MECTTMENNYEFLDSEEKYKGLEFVPIRITAGQYKDIDIMFNTVTMNIEYNSKTKEERLNMSFDVKILSQPENLNVTVDDKNFIDFVGNILYDIINNRMDVLPSLESPKEEEQVDLEADVHEELYGKDHP
jgi:hypothetical protein